MGRFIYSVVIYAIIFLVFIVVPIWMVGEFIYHG